jgi:hypothetical protein
MQQRRRVIVRTDGGRGRTGSSVASLIRSGGGTAAVLAVLAVAGACGRSTAPPPAAQPPPPAQPAAYVPGLGDLMLMQQARHAKIWLAGQAGNWDLATYEIDELSAGFDTVVKLYPKYKQAPVDPKDAIPLMVTEPISVLRAAAAKKDAKAFASAYDDLTTACNACHQATDYGVNEVQRPAGNPFPNQVFKAGQ